jgi:hypothetical protein
LTAGASGFPECSGVGWTNAISSWSTVQGTFMRVGVTPSGAYSLLTVATDPVGGVTRYVRTVDALPDMGNIALGTDNPAIGPAIEFLADDMHSVKEIDWVLGQQRDVSGRIVGLCLHGAVGPNNQDISNGPVFMMTRFGF